LELLEIALDTSTDDVKSVIYQAANAKNRNQEVKGNVSLQLEKIEAYLVELGRFNLESFPGSRLPLLNLPPNILEALQEGKLEYTKARTIARVKDEQQRDALLKETIAQGLALTEIKTKVKEAKVDPISEPAPGQVMIGRMGELTKRLKNSKAWEDRKKRDPITKLLDELERLTGED